MQNNTRLPASSITSLDLSILSSETCEFECRPSLSTTGTFYSSTDKKAQISTTGKVTGSGSVLGDITPLSGTNQLHNVVTQQPPNLNDNSLLSQTTHPSGFPQDGEKFLQHIGTQFSHSNRASGFDDLHRHHNTEDPLLSAINNGILQRKKVANIPLEVRGQGKLSHRVYRYWRNYKWTHQVETDTNTVLVDSSLCLSSPTTSSDVPSDCEGACFLHDLFDTDDNRRFVCHLVVGCSFEAPATDIQALIDHLFTHQQPVEVAITTQCLKKGAQKSDKPAKYRCRRPNCTRGEGFSRSDNRNTHERTCKGGEMTVDKVKSVATKRTRARKTTQPASFTNTEVTIESSTTGTTPAKAIQHRPKILDEHKPFHTKIEQENAGHLLVHSTKRQRRARIQDHYKSNASQNAYSEDHSPKARVGVSAVREVSGGLIIPDPLQDHNLSQNIMSPSQYLDPVSGLPTPPGRKDPSTSIPNSRNRTHHWQPDLAAASQCVREESMVNPTYLDGRQPRAPAACERVVNRERPPSTSSSAISWPASSFLPTNSLQSTQATNASFSLSPRLDLIPQAPLTASVMPYSEVASPHCQDKHWQALSNPYDEAFTARYRRY